MTVTQIKSSDVEEAPVCRTDEISKEKKKAFFFYEGLPWVENKRMRMRKKGYPHTRRLQQCA